MKGIKWLIVVVACIGLWLGSSATGFFYAVDRSLGNTEFVSRWLTRQNLTAVAASAREAQREQSSSIETSLLSGVGMSLLEPEIKKQAKPMLDPFYEFLKGKRQEPKLAIDLNRFKQDPELVKGAAKLVMANETARYLPTAMVESAARMLIEKLPNEIDFIRIFRVQANDLTHVRSVVDQFYSYYQTALLLSLFLVVLIVFILRDKRQIFITLGITLLISGLILFVPYLGSETMATKMFSRYKGVAPEVVKTLSATLIRDFFGVFVLSPLILSLAGLGGIIVGGFVFKKKD